MNSMYKWGVFIKERFNPVVYGVMIIAFFGAHLTVYNRYFPQSQILRFASFPRLLPLFIAVVLFFLKMRMFDEVKDSETDKTLYPERPIPRGLLSASSVRRAAFILAGVEIVLVSLYGVWAFISITVAVAYTLLMYKEFFLSTWIRAHLTTYAVSHTVVVVLLSLTLFIALSGSPVSFLPEQILYFSFSHWCIFNIFEFGRKTFAPQEEKIERDSYSKKFGKVGAVTLVVATAGIAMLCMKGITSVVVWNILTLWFCLLTSTGMLFIGTKSPSTAKVFRLVSSLYIILTYATILLLPIQFV
ncbi:MAG: UbiA family prenyltransferase [bacterium]